MTVSVVLVHGIRTSATMWRSQVEHLQTRGVPVEAIDLPGHGSRLDEDFTLDEAFATIDAAVMRAAELGSVLLVGHSMGGLVCTAYVGGDPACLSRDGIPLVSGFIAASCTAFPHGLGLATYRLLAAGFNRLPEHGAWLTERVLTATLPADTRDDFGAGGYAHRTQDAALSSLAALDLAADLPRIEQPLWFVNGQYDQLRLNERLFTRLAPHAELIVIPKATHLVTAMQPRAFNAALDLAIAVVARDTARRH
ncbi:alpha/beta fold hydrolase [Microbacterium gorillae]|uniref:alpha/beta fold hydrolase n=1 Tax=Microbacterium gorillae TaxID=1231063 RepID=UPI0005914329|nr:alpha/beta hydrolase [Microbacterium gorillae]